MHERVHWSCQSPAAHSCGPESHPNSFGGGMLKLNAKFDADSLLCLPSHLDYDNHTVHMLTQWHLPPPLTSTVKSSLFMHAHSSPLSLAARLHWCYINHSHYINNALTFSRQTLSVCYIIRIGLTNYLHFSITSYISLKSFLYFWTWLTYGIIIQAYLRNITVSFQSTTIKWVLK